MLTRLRMTTAGESHGPALLGVLDGLPAGVPLDDAALARELDRRRQGYGRSARMSKEHDHARVLAGVRDGVTMGAPLGIVIENADARVLPSFSTPRPGHADFAGMKKLESVDGRPVLERASARETAMRVALSTACRALLASVGVEVAGHVVAIGAERTALLDEEAGAVLRTHSLSALRERAARSPLSCVDDDAAARMVAAIDRARSEGDTLGGVIEVLVVGCPAGLGSYAQWDRRLSARIAAAVMSVPALKGVEIGAGFAAAARPGSGLHDAFFVGEGGGVTRASNRAGGIEGGMTNGEPVVVRAAMKPLPTLMRPLESVDLATGMAAPAHLERGDVCAVPAAAVVVEAMLCLVVADALLEKFGGDSLGELLRHMGRAP